FEHAPIGAWPPLPFDADSVNCLKKRPCASVQNGNLKLVEFDASVVDACSHQRREDMLSRRDEYAAPHQAGRIADFRNISSHCLDVEVVEIDAPEVDSAAGRSRKDTHLHPGSAVEADATKTDRLSNCLLLNQAATRKVLRKNRIPRLLRSRVWQKSYM